MRRSSPAVLSSPPYQRPAPEPFLRSRSTLADEGRPEVTTIGIRREPGEVKLIGGTDAPVLRRAHVRGSRSCWQRRALRTFSTSS